MKTSRRCRARRPGARQPHAAGGLRRAPHTTASITPRCARPATTAHKKTSPWRGHGPARETVRSLPPPKRRPPAKLPDAARSEEHTSELQSLMRNSYAVICLKKKKQTNKLDVLNQ